MPATLRFHRGVAKDLQKIPKNIREKFYDNVQKLESNPLLGIPLSGEFKGRRKLRLGNYRVVYAFYPKRKLVIVYRVESRQGVYKR